MVTILSEEPSFSEKLGFSVENSVLQKIYVFPTEKPIISQKNRVFSDFGDFHLP